MTEPKK